MHKWAWQIYRWNTWWVKIKSMMTSSANMVTEQTLKWKITKRIMWWHKNDNYLSEILPASQKSTGCLQDGEKEVNLSHQKRDRRWFSMILCFKKAERKLDRTWYQGASLIISGRSLVVNCLSFERGVCLQCVYYECKLALYRTSWKRNIAVAKHFMFTSWKRRCLFTRWNVYKHYIQCIFASWKRIVYSIH